MPLPYPSLTLFPARRIITMDASLPEATAVAVSGDTTSSPSATWRRGAKAAR